MIVAEEMTYMERLATAIVTAQEQRACIRRAEVIWSAAVADLGTTDPTLLEALLVVQARDIVPEGLSGRALSQRLFGCTTMFDPRDGRESRLPGLATTRRLATAYRRLEASLHAMQEILEKEKRKCK